MKKILVGWEAGQGLGHLSIVAPITKRLAWLQEPAEDIAVGPSLGPELVPDGPQVVRAGLRAVGDDLDLHGLRGFP